MFRQSIARPLVTANRAVARRSFSVAVPRMGEGDTGAPKSGGQASEYVVSLFLSLSPILCLLVFLLLFAFLGWHDSEAQHAWLKQAK